jgi:anti-sigma regulatory factor (Ser/Thr protein kinase)
MSALKRFSARHPAGALNEETLRGALALAREFAGECALDSTANARLAIVVEELVENALTYGARPGDVDIVLELSFASGRLSLVLEDAGATFDPRDAPEPALPRAGDGGGVGLAMVRAWSEVVSYERRGGRNRLELRIPIDDHAQAPER